MPIIGKLIKKTTEFTYKRNVNKSKEYYHQVISLVKLLDKARKTQFGRVYEFKDILLEDEVVDGFQKRVPITDYTEFHDKWLELCIEGKRDITWPGRIRHYALSSGTTGSPSKRIPVTVQMIRSFQKTSIKQISTLHALDLDEDFFSASLLAVGGSTKLTKMDTHIEGDLSGILKKYTSPVMAPFAKPGAKIARLKNWNEKLELMVEKAPEWNIGILAGVPSWCILLMEKIMERHNVSNIHEIWPNFKVYVHGGVFMDPYLPRLEKVLGQKIFTLDTYLSSEGYFAYQVSQERKGMELLLNNGIFFEFVPFNSDYFDDDGVLRSKHEAFTLNEVEEGVDYALVISTNAGLWRYMIGDLVRFVDLTQYEIVITGRIKQFLSLVGEHLSLDNINRGIHFAANQLNLTVSEFCIYADSINQRHDWYIGVDEAVDEAKLMRMIDEEIARANDDYGSVRNYTTLKDPQIQVIPTRYFYEFLEKRGKSGAQNKFPRVLNTEQSEEWISFIREKNGN